MLQFFLSQTDALHHVLLMLKYDAFLTCLMAHFSAILLSLYTYAKMLILNYLLNSCWQSMSLKIV